jgi:hypothetical protein
MTTALTVVIDHIFSATGGEAEDLSLWYSSVIGQCRQPENRMVIAVASTVLLSAIRVSERCQPLTIQILKRQLHFAQEVKYPARKDVLGRLTIRRVERDVKFSISASLMHVIA